MLNRALAARQKITRYRYVIVLFLMGGTFFNYMDRATLSVVAPRLQTELNISDTQLGFLLSSFGWSAVVAVLVAGFFLQKFGSRSLGGASLTGFSAATLLTATATTFPGLVFFRLVMGAFEAPTFAINSYMTRCWFPRGERAKATSAYMSAAFMGLAFAVPLLIWMVGFFDSWQSVFIFSGITGLIFAALWFWLVRTHPFQCPRVSPLELFRIRGGDGDVAASADKQGAARRKTRLTLQDWIIVLARRRLIGLYIAAFSTSTVIFFLITWFPIYLQQNLGFDFKSGGFWLASLPYIAAILGTLFSGWLSDRLIIRGVSVGRARKLILAIGLLGAGMIAIVPLLGEHPPLAMVLPLLLVVLFFAGISSNGWLLTAEIAPPRLLGLTTGMYGFWVNLTGAMTPVLVGGILEVTGRNFNAVFLYVAAAALLGFFSYIFVVDRAEPAYDPHAKNLGPTGSAAVNFGNS